MMLNVSKILKIGYGTRLSEVLRENYSAMTKKERSYWNNIELQGLNGDFDLGKIIDLLIEIRKISI